MMKITTPTPDMRHGHDEVPVLFKAKRQNAMSTTILTLEAITEMQSHKKSAETVLNLSELYKTKAQDYLYIQASHAALEASEINLSKDAQLDQTQYAQEVLTPGATASIDRVKDLPQSEVDTEVAGIAQASGIEWSAVNPIMAQAARDKLAKFPSTIEEIQHDIEETTRR